MGIIDNDNTIYNEHDIVIIITQLCFLSYYHEEYIFCCHMDIIKISDKTISTVVLVLSDIKINKN
jgi:hypothetical protein